MLLYTTQITEHFHIELFDLQTQQYSQQSAQNTIDQFQFFGCHLYRKNKQYFIDIRLLSIQFLEHRMYF